jgi:hypothetical protein
MRRSAVAEGQSFKFHFCRRAELGGSKRCCSPRKWPESSFAPRKYVLSRSIGWTGADLEVTVVFRAWIVTLRNAVSASISECPRLARGMVTLVANAPGLPGGWLRSLLLRALSTPSSPFSSGGGAAAGERGRRGFDVSALAANVKLPRTSRGHRRHKPGLLALRKVTIQARLSLRESTCFRGAKDDIYPLVRTFAERKTTF